jgi:hypothetical protein
VSYSLDRREVADEALPTAYRYRALRRCVASYASLTNCGYRSVLDDLRLSHEVPREIRAEAIRAAFAELDAARRRYLIVFFAFGELRRGQKRRGIRRPLRADVRELEDVITLGTPRSRIHRDVPGERFCVGASLGAPSDRTQEPLSVSCERVIA